MADFIPTVSGKQNSRVSNSVMPVVYATIVSIVLLTFTFYITTRQIYAREVYPWSCLFAGLALAFFVSGFTYLKIREPHFLKLVLQNKPAEPKKEELKFRHIVESSSVGLYVIQDGKFAYVNPRMAQIFGYSHREMIGLKALSSVYGKDSEKVSNSIQARLTGKIDSVQYQVRMLKKNGEKIWNDVHGASTLYNGKPAIVGSLLDITLKKELEMKVREASHMFQSLMENTSESIILMGKDYRIITYNKTAGASFKLYGLGEISEGADFRDFAPADTRESFSAILQKALKGEMTDDELKLRDPGGKLYWLRIKGSPVHDLNKKLTGAAILLEDITERMEAQAAVADAELKFRSLVERSMVGVSIMREGSFLYMNPKLSEMFGYKEGEMTNGLDLLSLIHPHDRERVSAYMLQLAQDQASSTQFTTRALKKNGDFIWIEILCSANQYKGEQVLMGTFRDITEEKHQAGIILNEKNISEAIINALPGIFYMADERGHLLRWNKNLETLPGLASNKLEGLPVEDALGNAYKNFMDFKRYDLSRHGKITAEVTIPAGEYDRHYYFTVINTECKGEARHLAIGTDVTEQYKAELELKRTYQDLRRLNKYLHNIREEERASIAREIHDELGQMLTGIKMDTSWILRKLPATEAPLKEKAQETILLIDDTIKTVRRISSELRPGVLDDLGLVAALEWQSGEFEKRSGIKCNFTSDLRELKLSKELSNSMFRVYQESLTNIMRHSEATSVHSLVFLSDRQMVLEIKDNGKGFDTSARKKTLGLIGMNERAEMVGGSLKILSEPGHGTTVVLSIPVN